MLIPESFLDNEMHKLRWDFEIQTDHRISARRPDLVIVNNKKKKKERTCRTVDFAILADHWVKLKASEKKDKYLDLAKGMKKLCIMKVTGIPAGIGVLVTVTKGLINGLGNKRTSGENSNYSIVTVGQNTSKNPKDLRRLAVTQTPVRKPSVNACVKTSQRS